MTNLKDGALDGLTEEQKARKLATHERLNRAFGLASKAPATVLKTPAVRQASQTMLWTPTPFGTRAQLHNTPSGARSLAYAEKAAERSKLTSLAGQERSKVKGELKKEFNKTQEKSIIRTRDRSRSRGRER